MGLTVEQKFLRQIAYVSTSLETLRSVATSTGDTETLLRCDEIADDIAELVASLRWFMEAE